MGHKSYIMKEHEAIPLNSQIENISERNNRLEKHRACGNDAVKQEMAEALLAQGISEEAVCRLLHIDSEMLPDNG